MSYLGANIANPLTYTFGVRTPILAPRLPVSTPTAPAPIPVPSVPAVSLPSSTPVAPSGAPKPPSNIPAIATVPPSIGPSIPTPSVTLVPVSSGAPSPIFTSDSAGDVVSNAFDWRSSPLPLLLVGLAALALVTSKKGR